MAKLQAYKHQEAFCVMKYECKSCGWTMTIWNSRDGVTPMGTLCQKCREGSSVHVRWQSDVRAPEYTMKSGALVWIDMPLELRRPVARMGMAGVADEELARYGDTREELVRAIAGNTRKGEPFLIRIP